MQENAKFIYDRSSYFIENCVTFYANYIESLFFLHYIAMLISSCKIKIAALYCVVLLSCESEFWKDSSPIVAEVESSRLHLNELREKINENEPASKEELARRIETWINFEIMYREAVKRGLQKDPATQRLIKNAEKKILVDRLRVTMDSTVYKESEKELQEFYENNKELFRIDSASYLPFSEVKSQIRNAVISEKRLDREKKWLAETKNSYSIDVYPQYLDSLW
jgi:uncharacterized protein YdhG (YjbR/CyaY superfamily)